MHAGANTGVNDLSRNHRLLVADGGHHQRHRVRESFAHRVMTSVADHRVQVREQVEQRDEIAYKDMVGHHADQIGRRDQNGLQPVGQRCYRLHRGGEEPPACLSVDGAQRYHHVLAIGIQPFPGEG
jgi:hypothetical protein